MGLGFGENFLASDNHALLPVTNRFIFLEEGDVVDLALTDKHGKLVRYRIQPQAPGWVAARQLESDPEAGEDEGLYDSPIRGEWQPHTQGYTLELRLPRDMLQNRLSLRIFDSHSQQLLGSGHMFPPDALGRIIERSAMGSESRLLAFFPTTSRGGVNTCSPPSQ